MATAVTIDPANNSVTMLDIYLPPGVQIADPSALTSLVSTVQGRFERIRTAINATKQMPENSRSGWMGAARNTCEQTVGQFASNAVTATNNAEQQLVNYLTKQRDAVVESTSPKHPCSSAEWKASPVGDTSVELTALRRGGGERRQRGRSRSRRRWAPPRRPTASPMPSPRVGRR